MTITTLLTDAETKRKQIRASAISGIASLFPVDEKGLKITVADLEVVPKLYSNKDVKNALLSGGTLNEPMYGTLVVSKDGKVVLRNEKFLFLRLPYMTDQHTFVVGGNAYSVGNQLRTRSGIYARFRRNEVPEVSFNLAKGANFKITLDQSSMRFNMEFGTSKSPLYPVVKLLGISTSDLTKHWGEKVARANMSMDEMSSANVISGLYDRLVKNSDKSQDDTAKEKGEKLKTYFQSTVLDPETTNLTIGLGVSSASGLALVLGAKKLISIHEEDAETDDRDSLEFQKIHSVEDFINERITKGGKEVINKIKAKLQNSTGDNADVKSRMSASPFTGTVNSLITQFSLSRTPDQINPIEVLDGAMKVTRMGDGGISSLRAVPEETRELHASHLGVLDPVRTPESQNIGVDLRATIRMAKDENGRIYAPLMEVSTGKFRHVYVGELRGKKIAFANQELKGTVDVVMDSKVLRVPASQVDFQVPHSQDMFGPSSTLIPFISNMQGNRALMASKQMTQALPLKYREEPLVQVAAPKESAFDSMHKELGSQIIKTAPEDCTVTKVDDEFIHITGKSGVQKISYTNDLPFNSKTYLNEDVIVKVGDKLKKGDRLTESNFTKNGAVALGINARVGYIPYNGENSNDAIVISETAAKKFTSLHMFKETLEKDSSVLMGKSAWKGKFPNKYSMAVLNKFEESGLPKKGVQIAYGEPVILALRKTEPNQTDVLLGRLDKTLKNPYRDASIVWEKEDVGTVTDVVDSPKMTAVTLKVESAAREGDKLCGFHGNKGVIGKIVADDQMIQDSSGRPLEVLVTSAGVMTRINPSQVLETAAGKAAEVLGKTIVIDNFSPKDDVQRIKKLIKGAGLTDKETVFDPMTGRKIDNIFVGKQYMAKLFKSTDTNFAARGIGGYSTEDQPTKGGKESASRLGPMEVNALLAHGTPDLLKEMGQLKSQNNVDWWNAYTRGETTPNVKRPFIMDKFHGMLEGSQINIRETKSNVMLAPQTDADVLAKSSGALTSTNVLRKKDLKPEYGGLFDPVRTGGLEGSNWTHIELPERIVKPVYAKAAASVLGVSANELNRIASSQGGDAVFKMLGDIDIEKERASILKDLDSLEGMALDKSVKRLKYIDGLRRTGLSAAEAYTGKIVPVVPPKMRPIVPGPGGALLVADANHLYRDTMLAAKKLQEMKDVGLPDSDIANMRKELTNSVGAIVGLNDPTSYKLQQQEKKGFIKKLSGYKPSEGMFQRKVIGRAQDISGRGTIAPDPTLGVDQIGLPEDSAYGMYSPMVMKNLVKKGFSALDAAKAIKERSASARQALDEETSTRPLIYNRAPTLTRNSMISAYPVIVPGKTIRMSPFSEPLLGSDYDGDAVQLHVPVTTKAITDAKKLLLSNLLFSDKSVNDLQVKPQHEAIIGIHNVLSQKSSGKTFKFKSLEEAKLAYLRGEVKANDEIEILD